MDWENLFRNFGFPVVCLVAIGYAVWKASGYLALNVVQPMVARHMRFMDKMEETLNAHLKQSEETARISEESRKITEANAKIVEKTSQLAEETVNMTRSLLTDVKDVKSVIIRTQGDVVLQTTNADRKGPSHAESTSKPN
jgi:hypothetical protein